MPLVAATSLAGKIETLVCCVSLGLFDDRRIFYFKASFLSVIVLPMRLDTFIVFNYPSDQFPLFSCHTQALFFNAFL